MNIESENIKQIEKTVDNLKIRTIVTDSTVQYVHHPLETPSKHVSQTRLGIHSDSDEDKKENTTVVKYSNGEQKSDLTVDLIQKYQLISF